MDSDIEQLDSFVPSIAVSFENSMSLAGTAEACGRAGRGKDFIWLLLLLEIIESIQIFPRHQFWGATSLAFRS